MANFTGHLTGAAICAAAYGAGGSLLLQLDWGPVFLGAGLTLLGGLLPDLDSDSGVPLRELFNLMGGVVPILLIPRLRRAGFTLEQILVLWAGAYLFVRFGLSEIFKRFTVHRGMFHSIPAILISGLCIFLLYHNGVWQVRLFLAGGVMVGYLCHLLLDEFYSIDLMGVRIKASAGTALKLFSSSYRANLATYALLGFLGWMAHKEWRQDQGDGQVVHQVIGTRPIDLPNDPAHRQFLVPRPR